MTQQNNPLNLEFQLSGEGVQTLAITCLNIMTMLPPRGTAQSYEAILLKGSVKSTIFA